MRARIARSLVRLSLLLLWTACASLGGGPQEAVSSEPPYWWVVQARGSKIVLLEREPGPPGPSEGGWSQPHVLEAGLRETGAPALAVHRGSVWLAWRDGTELFTRPVWWGPAKRRRIPASEALSGGPALASDGDRLVAVWAEGDRLVASASRFGIEWSDPQGLGARPTTDPAVALHRGELFVAYGEGRALKLSRLAGNLSWARPWRIARLGGPVDRGVSLVSADGRMTLGATTAGAGFTLRSRWAPWRWRGRRWLQPEARVGPRALDLAVHDGRVHSVDHGEEGLIFSHSSERRAEALVQRVAGPATAGSVPRLVASPYTFQAPLPEVTLVHDSGRSAADTTNLVFVSEGYAAEALPRYRALVGRVADNFLATNPISKQRDKLNIFRIDLASRERGVDAAPAMARAVRQGVLTSIGHQAAVPGFAARATDTALGAYYRACWTADHQNFNEEQIRSGPNNPTTPRCDAGEEPEHEHTAITTQKAIHIFADETYSWVAKLVPGFETSRDLLYVIVDQHPEDGATNKASYNPVVTTPDFAEWITNLHEIGHFWTRLADEDMTVCCGLTTGECRCPNLTKNDDLDDPEHPWAHYFVRDGRPGDSVVASPKSRPPDRQEYYDPAHVTARDVFNVGLWPTLGTRDWARTKGEIVYAPAHRCLMNHTGAITAFCPICAETLTRELFERSGLHFHDHAYHARYERVFVEYLHRAWPIRELPKAELLSVNGWSIPVSQFSCTVMAPGLNDREVCSVDVTDYVGLGPDQLVFHALEDNPRTLDLLSLQVVNSNGASLPLHPVTDLSGIGIERYFQAVAWDFADGDLEFEFDAKPLPPPPTLTVGTQPPNGPVPH